MKGSSTALPLGAFHLQSEAGALGNLSRTLRHNRAIAWNCAVLLPGPRRWLSACGLLYPGPADETAKASRARP